jgi:hypothetical protein
MAEYLIDRIKESLGETGIEPGTSAARRWIQSKIKGLSASRTSLMRNIDRNVVRTIIGKMYFFFYTPKLNDSLRYYDRFPLVLPIEQYDDGFLGLNLHYIHPKHRVILLDKFSNTLTDKNFDEDTRFRINYDYIRRASSASEARPCIKRYLFENVKSRFLEINSDEWDIASLLPVEDFFGAAKEIVFNESRKKY